MKKQNEKWLLDDDKWINYHPNETATSSVPLMQPISTYAATNAVLSQQQQGI